MNKALPKSFLSVHSTPPSLSSSVSEWLDSIPGGEPSTNLSHPGKRQRHAIDGPDDPRDVEALCSGTLQMPAGKKRRPDTDNPAPESFSASHHGSPIPRASRGKLTHSQASPSRLSYSNLSSQTSTPSRLSNRPFNSLTKLSQLELADPKVLFRTTPPPDPPLNVRNLYQVFSDNSTLDGFIPNLPDVLAKFPITQKVPKILIQEGAPTTKDSDFFAHALDIFHTVHEITLGSLDEQNWYLPVWQILRWPLPPRFEVLPRRPLLSAVEVQNSLFDTAFIPKIGHTGNEPVELAKHIGGVNVDQILMFDNYHPLLLPSHNILRAHCYARPNIIFPAYSPFLSQVLSERFIAALVEVKVGSESEIGKALSQIALAAAAVLEAEKRLSVGCMCQRRCRCVEGWEVEGIIPVVCFVVEKTTWTLRIAYWEDKGSIRITDSTQVGNMSTFEGICRLLRLIESIKSWMEKVVVPYLVETMEGWVRKLKDAEREGDSDDPW
ncbi:MAG: hypothetical protein M1840_008651 [Geoglossum simile]|nr:MAG: hypothetical protein M1840_008651 [Geoglossum simile]